MGQGTIYQRPRVEAKPHEKVVTSTCGHNCGGRCVVNAHVVDGRIVRSHPTQPVEPGAAAAAGLRARLRPDRARVPPRPAAISDAAHRAARRRASSSAFPGTRRSTRSRGRCCACGATYGNAAILDASRSGSLSVLHGRTAAQRFLYKFGGCTRAVVEHVGGGRGLRRAHDLRRQGRPTKAPAASPPTTSTPS